MAFQQRSRSARTVRGRRAPGAVVSDERRPAWYVNVGRPVVMAVAGIFLVVLGPLQAGSTPSCAGETMSPGDVCLRSGTRSETYEEALESGEEASVWMPRAGAGLVAAAGLSYLVRVAISARRGEVAVIGSVGWGADQLVVAVAGTGLLGGVPGRNLRDRWYVKGLRWEFQGGQLWIMARQRRSRRVPVTLYVAPETALELLRRRARRQEVRAGRKPGRRA